MPGRLQMLGRNAVGLGLVGLLTSCSLRSPQSVPAPTPYTVQLHERTVPMPVPADNPLTVEGVALGRFLFYDPLLSEDRSVTCASCHQQAHGFSDPRPVSLGVHGREGRRNAMPLFNLAWSTSFFWDGRAPTLEAQVLMPLQNQVEMARDLDDLVADLGAHPDYPARFRAAFPDEPISATTVSKALAQFVRSIVSFDATWDHIGHISEVDDEAAARGHHPFTEPLPLGAPDGVMNLCDSCHPASGGLKPGWEGHAAGTFMSDALRNNGLPVDPKDAGAFEVTGHEKDRGLFKVPSIRNLKLTGPYMHDGRFATLEEVLDHYNEHVAATATLDPVLMRQGEPMRMAIPKDTYQDVIAFLDLFTDRTLTTNPAWSDPFASE